MLQRQVAVLLAVWLVAAVGVHSAEAQRRSAHLESLVVRLDLKGQGVDKWLERLGAETKGAVTERLIALDANGKALAESTGHRSSVDLDMDLEDLLRQPGRSVVLVHNHPASVGLSGPDIDQLSKPGVAAIAAIGHDGSVFLASAGVRMRTDIAAWRQYERADAEVTKRLRLAWPSGRVSISVSDGHHSHLVTLALARAGVIDYWFSLRGPRRRSYFEAFIALDQVVGGAAAALRR